MKIKLKNTQRWRSLFLNIKGDKVAGMEDHGRLSHTLKCLMDFYTCLINMTKWDI